MIFYNFWNWFYIFRLIYLISLNYYLHNIIYIYFSYRKHFVAKVYLPLRTWANTYKLSVQLIDKNSYSTIYLSKSYGLWRL